MIKYILISNNRVTDIFDKKPLSEVSGGFILEVDDVLVKMGQMYSSIDGFYDEDLTILGKGNKNNLVKQIASQKIKTILSDTDQRNSLYTLYKHGKKAKSSLTADEKAEIQELESKWDTIETIRKASNTIEAAINNLKKIEEVQDYDINNNPLWPK